MNVDPEQLKRVVNNIISNSVKYMAEGRQGKIKIDLYDEGDYIHAIFSDNGIGIAEGEGTTMHLNLLKAKDEENPENA